MVSVTQDIRETGIYLPGIIELVSRPAKTPSGLSRYGDTLARSLRRIGLPVVKRQTKMPDGLRFFADIGSTLGYDLPAFFENYPIGGQFTHNALYHLASENLASLLNFKPLRPAIITVHGLFTYILRNDPDLRMYNHVFQKFFDALVIRGLRRADHLICVSDYLKKVLVEQIEIPSNKITVVYEAVDHEIFYPARVPEDFYDRFGLSTKRRYVLYVGSEQPRKNFLTLLKAFARLREQLLDVYLIKVGQAEFERERDKALRLIAALNLQEAVTFIGHIGDELPQFYRAAEIFVFPSLYEGFGFPPLEAMSCGTPVICSNTTSLPEVVGDAALLVDPLDDQQLAAAMLKLMTDPELYLFYKQQGLENVHRFQWEKTARETAEVYRRVLSDEHRTNGSIE